MRRPLPLRRGAAALLLPLALSTFVACGGDSEPTGSSKAAEPQVSEGEEIPTAEFMDMLEEAFEGATTARVTMTNDGEFGMSAEGDVDYASKPPAMSITMSNPAMGGEIETVMVDGVMYMKSEELGGEKYIKMDLGAAQGLGGEDLTNQMDPRESLGQMEKAVTSVTYVGEEDVDGEDMERYTLAIDTQKMVGDLGTGAAEMPAELSYDIWFDDEGLFRRTAMDMGEKAGTMEMTLSDWGKDVEIKAPPADQVVEMPQMPSAPPTAGS